ncbi:MAG: Gfo/Idh/MocA family oxidoreductase [Geminicoccaceae bacterium]|nr:Gfo/Idh/MocA family oxidoreductase [Geminicoccaceae bacterium]
MNICMIGHGMMGVWHSQALAGATGAVLHTVVGRRAGPTAAFAERFGYRRWTVDLDEALSDAAIDAVIVASPSQQHVDHALRAIGAGKHVLVEIPLGMSLGGVDRVLAAAVGSTRTLGMVHPMRARPEMVALHERVARGEERVHMVEGRFFIHRLENVGATGYRRSWTDNALWHHAAHLVDFAVWMLGEDLGRVEGWMGPVDERTGIPMTTHIRAERPDGAMTSCLLTYYGREFVNQTTVATDRDSYCVDTRNARMVTGSDTIALASEADNVAILTRDFVTAARDGRPPMVPIAAVRPAMAILETVQRQWDERYGAVQLPGRPDDA